jgi:hypothetical protein
VTLSAVKGGTRLITHLTEAVSVSVHAQPHDHVPDPSVIAVRPLVPGVPTDPVTSSPGRDGGSGASGGKR